MRTNEKVVALAMICFLAGFLTHSWLTPKRQPSPIAPVSTIASFAMLTPPTVATQVLRFDDGTWFRHPDGVLRRTPPTMSPEPLAPHLRRGYYDLIDTRYEPPPIDLN